jgi:deoxycytidylate deaminase
MIISSGIKRVVYKTAYRDTNSLQILEKANLVVEKWEE